MSQLYNNIRKLREWNSLTQQNVADELKISQKHYSRIELGQVDISLSMLEKIAGIFNIKVQNLFGMEDVNIFNSVNNNHQKGGQLQAYLQTEIEQVQALYERLLREKDEKIDMLQSFLEKGKE